MALRFNLNLLETETLGDAKRLVELLWLHYSKKTIPKSFRSRKPLNNLLGNSFLLNAASLFKDRSTDVIFKAQYIRLAGRRDYANYLYYGHTYLDLSFFQDIDLDAIKHNPLLTIKENKIYFKFEEI
jgi:hypothetical protein